MGAERTIRAIAPSMERMVGDEDRFGAQGLPREVMYHGVQVTTAIYKEAVAGRGALRKLNL